MAIIERIANRLGFASRAQVENMVSTELRTTKKQMTRAFEAARIDRLSSDWSTTPSTTNDDLRKGLTALVARSRDLSKNNDYIKGFIRLVKNNVIGSDGIALQARAMDTNGKLDTEANKAIEAAWLEWCRYGTPDVTGLHSFDSLLRLIVELIIRDGEVLLRRVQGKHNKFNLIITFRNW